MKKRLIKGVVVSVFAIVMAISGCLEAFAIELNDVYDETSFVEDTDVINDEDVSIEEELSVYGAAGDSLETAKEIILGQNMASSGDVVTGKDLGSKKVYYKITLPKAAYIEIQSKATGGTVSWNLYDESEYSSYSIQSDYRTFGDEKTTKYYLHRGTYYLVYSTNVANGEYQLTTVKMTKRDYYDESFPETKTREDDMITQANAITLDSKYSGFLGKKYNKDDVDYYKINLTGGVTYTFRLNGNIYPIVTTADGKRSWDLFRQDYRTLTIPSTGTYYIKYDYKEYQGAYDFKVSREDGLIEGGLYRFSRPDGGDWLITSNFEEIQVLLDAKWKNDGLVGMVGEWGKGTAVVRFYNKYTNDRMYSNNDIEINNYVNASAAGWVKEGPAFYTSPTAKTSVIRYATPTGIHIWSIDPFEQENFNAAGWDREGEAFRVN